MTNPSPIETTVMRRVARLRGLRALFSGTTLAMLVFVVALWGIGREVWVAKVFANGPQDSLGHIRYLAYALEHTRFIVQALVLVSFAAVVYLAREAAGLIAGQLVIRSAS